MHCAYGSPKGNTPEEEVVVGGYTFRKHDRHCSCADQRDELVLELTIVVGKAQGTRLSPHPDQVQRKKREPYRPQASHSHLGRVESEEPMFASSSS